MNFSGELKIKRRHGTLINGHRLLEKEGNDLARPQANVVAKDKFTHAPLRGTCYERFDFKKSKTAALLESL